ncbi:MAG: tyrosine-type recombinase/integrase [Legionellaceae bacterium]|nr:tyrosine-type recombinase/integrase [Legionellaceae bacterium]
MEKFTHKKIDGLTAKKGRYHITEGNGFCLRVSPTGTKTWFYRYKFNGKDKWLTMGRFPAMGVAEARSLFNELWNIRQSGEDPEIQLNQPSSPEDHATVEQLVNEWYLGYIKKHRAHPQQIKQIIDADIIPLLGDKQLHTLKTKEITIALDKIVNRGAPVHANKVLAALKQAFNYGVSRGDMLLNPAANIRARDIGGFEKARDRYLTLDEIKELWFFLDSEKNHISLQIKNALKIILLTGVRTGELRTAKWSEFDFENSLWTIPAENTKTVVIMRVHLTELTKSLLVQLKKNNSSEYVISGVDETSCITDKAIPRAVKRIQERLGIPQWTAHDLRRTFATQLGETLDIDPVVIEKCLGHKMPKIMATYNKNEMLPQRKEALEQWSKCILNLVEVPS